MNEANSVLLKGAELRTQHLTTQGLTRMGGSLTVDRSLALTSLDPSHPYSDQAIVGLGAQKLTLGEQARVSASFSDDYLATGNYAYDKTYTLVTTSNAPTSTFSSTLKESSRSSPITRAPTTSRLNSSASARIRFPMRSNSSSVPPSPTLISPTSSSR